eukprot:scaffold34673_cov23-Tisochrysis_lutea.AAC.1
MQETRFRWNSKTWEMQTQQAHIGLLPSRKITMTKRILLPKCFHLYNTIGGEEAGAFRGHKRPRLPKSWLSPEINPKERNGERPSLRCYATANGRKRTWAVEVKLVLPTTGRAEAKVLRRDPRKKAKT